MAELTQTQFASEVLKQLGIAPNRTNMAKMVAWMNQEGGNWHNNAKYNPLNTTLEKGGASTINSAGVKSYSSWQQGINATVQTLTGGSYNGILSNLKGSGNLASFESAVNSSPWGTKFPGGGKASTATSEGESPVGEAVSSVGSVFSGIGGSISTTAKLAQVVGNWIAEPMKPLKLVGGGILIAMGLRTLTRTGAGGSVQREFAFQTAPVRSVATPAPLKLKRRVSHAARAHAAANYQADHQVSAHSRARFSKGSE